MIKTVSDDEGLGSEVEEMPMKIISEGGMIRGWGKRWTEMTHEGMPQQPSIFVVQRLSADEEPAAVAREGHQRGQSIPSVWALGSYVRCIICISDVPTAILHTHLTTTIEKSGGGGAVFLNGVAGLYRWKKIV